MSLFLNPWTFIAGALLVSTPIIIHLINRIRFRRVKWAAMEFLLKAQKRMRRRKILEQLLLLLMRCLLVFLAGVLFARYIGGIGGDNAKETRPTSHVVILDDTPSMGEGWRREDGPETNAFSEARRLVYEKLMPAAAEATTAQTMQVLLLSDPDRQFPDKMKEVDGKRVPKNQDEIQQEARVNGKNITAMADHLKQLQVSTVRRSLVAALRKAKERLDQAPASDARMVHVVSDLRAVDWNADGPTIKDLLREFKEAGIAVHLIDVSNPARKADRKSPPFSDNVAIVELKPRNHIVSVGQQTELEVRVKNYGNTDLKDVRIDFYLNDKPDLISTLQIPTLPANQERVGTTTATFNPPGATVGTKEKPLDRFNIITAVLPSSAQDGLKIDNFRRAVVEVRDSIKVLMIDGRTVEGGIDLRERPEGDSFYLRSLLLNPKTEAVQRLGKVDLVSAEAGQLDKIDLRRYTTVYLMNVPTLSEAAVANLERFVKDGGGVGVFLGPNVKPDDYTKRMYRNTAGFFPVPLPAEPTKEPTLEQKILRSSSLTARLMPRNPNAREHPALKGVYTDENGHPVKPEGVEKFFRLPIINQYWPVSRRGAWREDARVRELYCLQNEAPIAEFEAKTEALVAEIRKRYNEPKFQNARKYLDEMLPRIQKLTKEANPLSELARMLDELLCDLTNTGHESEPILRDFWAQPEMAETRSQAVALRDEVKFGPPLYLVKRFGRGHVAVMTVDAGGTYTGKKQWNDWPSGQGSAGWIPVVTEMHKYLSGGGEEGNRSVGESFTAEFDSARYEPTVSVQLLTTETGKTDRERSVPVIRKELAKVTMDLPPPPPGTAPDAPPPPLKLTFGDSKQPGAYLFTLTRKKGADLPEGGPAKPDPLGDLDFVGVAFNVDAINEGDLRRANTDDLAQHTNKTPLHNTEDLSWIDELKQKPSDLSSRRWLYLVILLLLIAEQAWAVRISYHTKPEDLEALAPSAAAAYAHHTTALPASNGEVVAEEAAPAERV